MRVLSDWWDRLDHSRQLLAGGERPDLTGSSKLPNVFDFRDLIDPVAFAYMDEGGKDEISLKENRLAFRRIILRPRFLTDVHEIDVSTELLGREMDLPVYICPAGRTAFGLAAKRRPRSGRTWRMPCTSAMEASRNPWPAGRVRTTGGSTQREASSGPVMRCSTLSSASKIRRAPASASQWTACSFRIVNAPSTTGQSGVGAILAQFLETKTAIS